jgi:hypothetical protein
MLFTLFGERCRGCPSSLRMRDQAQDDEEGVLLDETKVLWVGKGPDLAEDVGR